MKKKICHVCGKEKKPYIVFMDDNILSWLQHEQAREDGEICQRCDQYHAMTGEFKDATEEEFELAKKSCEFARNMLKWWEKIRNLMLMGEVIVENGEELLRLESGIGKSFQKTKHQNKRSVKDKMKICDYCNKEIKGQEYSIEVGKWIPNGDSISEEILLKELHSKCADEVMNLIKKYKKDLKKIGGKTLPQKERK